MIDVGALTELLLSSLASGSGCLVGDVIAPSGVGWLDGQPNTGVFVPYLTLTGSGSSAWPQRQGLDDAKMSWACTYQVRVHGGSRSQVDRVATRSRAAVEALERSQFGASPYSYKVVGLEWGSLGSPSRVESTDPPYWQATDGVSMLCVKVRG